MKKLTANLSLVMITFFAAIQYAFLSGVPSDVSPILFLALTNGIGFLFTLLLFHRELRGINKRVVIKCLVLSLELLGFDAFLLLGAMKTDPAVSACVLSLYFLLIMPLQSLFGKKPSLVNVAGTGVVGIGLLMVLESRFAFFTDVHILYLIVADLFFAAYIITVERFARDENAPLLATGQTFFVGILTAVLFLAECLAGRTVPELTTSFWSGVIYMGIFIRGIYSVIQIRAQRYVSALNTSLIFSTEVLITILISPLLGRLLKIPYTPVKLIHIGGGILMVCGIMLADSTVMDTLKRRVRHGNTDGT